MRALVAVLFLASLTARADSKPARPVMPPAAPVVTATTAPDAAPSPATTAAETSPEASAAILLAPASCSATPAAIDRLRALQVSIDALARGIGVPAGSQLPPQFWDSPTGKGVGIALAVLAGITGAATVGLQAWQGYRDVQR